jgi:hypothetical protein
MQNLSANITNAGQSSSPMDSLVTKKAPSAKHLDRRADVDSTESADDVAAKFRQLLKQYSRSQSESAAAASEIDGQEVARGNISLLQGLAVDVAIDVEVTDMLAADMATENHEHCVVLCYADPEMNIADQTMSAEQMAELAAMMHKFPQLQEILKGKLDLSEVSKAIDVLQHGGKIDLLKLDLSPELKNTLTKIADRPELLANLGSALKMMQQNPDLLAKFQVNIADLSDDLPKVGVMEFKPVVELEKVAPKEANILQNARGVVETTLKTQLPEMNKLIMLEEVAKRQSHAVDMAPKEISEISTLSFNQALDAVSHVTNALQANKTSLLTTASLDAYAAHQARADSMPSANIASMQLAVQMQRNAQTGRANGFIVQLQPEELGKVEVIMKFDGKRMRASIIAEKEETLALMKEDASYLESALRNAGLEANAGSLEFSLSQNSEQFTKTKNNRDRDDGFGTMIADKVTEEMVLRDLKVIDAMWVNNGRVNVRI